MEGVINMPGKDGTGPMGQGSGMGMGRGMGRGRRGGVGPEGFCVCPSCGTKVVHQVGVPCSSMNCPKCNSRMVRG